VRKVGDVVRKLVQSDAHWNAIQLTVQTLTPVLKLLRLTDGKTGATLGKVYNHMAVIDELYASPIEGMEDELREKMHKLWMARWTYFHEPVFTAAYFLDPEYTRGNGSTSEEAESRQVLRELADSEHCPFSYSDMISEWGDLQTAIAMQSHGMHDKEAFAPKAQKKPAFQWALIFLYEWPAIQWCAQRLSSLACSASPCEHSWSIEGWIHSKKRNRLGQTFVERLLRAHTNLLLDSKLEEWQLATAVLPWELEMSVDDPEDSDDSESELSSEER
jgi:hypothetical protein